MARFLSMPFTRMRGFFGPAGLDVKGPVHPDAIDPALFEEEFEKFGDPALPAHRIWASRIWLDRPLGAEYGRDHGYRGKTREASALHAAPWVGRSAGD
jgi:hypothetical protein